MVEDIPAPKGRYLCEALVDQGRHIGNDPVGYSCYRVAAFRWGQRVVCQTCYELLKLAFSKGVTSRITFSGRELTDAERELSRESHIRGILTLGPPQ